MMFDIGAMTYSVRWLRGYKSRLVIDRNWGRAVVWHGDAGSVWYSKSIFWRPLHLMRIVDTGERENRAK
jgi:hypothetical protein